MPTEYANADTAKALGVTGALPGMPFRNFWHSQKLPK